MLVARQYRCCFQHGGDENSQIQIDILKLMKTYASWSLMIGFRQRDPLSPYLFLLECESSFRVYSYLSSLNLLATLVRFSLHVKRIANFWNGCFQNCVGEHLQQDSP